MFLIENAYVEDEGAEKRIDDDVAVDETLEFGKGGQEEEPAERHNEQQQEEHAEAAINVILLRFCLIPRLAYLWRSL